MSISREIREALSDTANALAEVPNSVARLIGHLRNRKKTSHPQVLRQPSPLVEQQKTGLIVRRESVPASAITKAQSPIATVPASAITKAQSPSMERN